MVSGKAPARRVGWFAGVDTAAVFTNQGVALLDAAVRWVSGVASPLASWCQGGSFEITAVWDPGGGGSSDGRASFSGGAPVQIPASLPVTGGRSGQGRAIVTLRSGSRRIDCAYRGQGQPGSSDPLELARATQFVFESCSGGSLPGFVSRADSVTLHVESADPGAGLTSVLFAQSCAGDNPVNEQPVTETDGVFTPEGDPLPEGSPEITIIPPDPGEYPDPFEGSSTPEVDGQFTPEPDPELVAREMPLDPTP
jgi:hypothetical protein